jgi:DNA polymerase V
MARTHNFALVDCNCFYVSCERLFRPDLEKKPVVVLSNNDGCVVSRSQEAKDIGIGMGVPYFQIKDLLKRNRGHAFSSNYELYADMSSRVMDTLKEYSPELEIYSIDEAFLHLDYCQDTNYLKFADEIKEKVFKVTGIPVSIGIAKTKTLAKVANELAKTKTILNGSLSFIDLDRSKIESYLSLLPVNDVWGIGRKSAEKLHKIQVFTALDLAKKNEQTIKQILTISGMKTVLELRGKSCFALEIACPQKSVVVSRSFGQLVGNIGDLKEALSTHIFHGTERLRKQGLQAQCLTIFINTNYHRTQDKQHFVNKTISLDAASNYPSDFIKPALKTLDKMFKNGYLYKKAGVVFTAISSDKESQQNLYSNDEPTWERKSNLTKAIDCINDKYGRETLTIASMGSKPKWKMKREMKSFRFTTNWNELLSIK